MTITYDVLPGDDVIRETWQGEITIAMFRDHVEAVLHDDECLRRRRSLVDLRQAHLVFSERELQDAVREVCLPLLAGTGWISAIVVRQGLQLRMASRYRAIASLYSHDAIFSGLEEAERWLMKQEQHTPAWDAGAP